jgi:hypothetical protein
MNEWRLELYMMEKTGSSSQYCSFQKTWAGSKSNNYNIVTALSSKHNW